MALVTIRYNDQSRPINLNCKCGVILEHIRKCGNFEASLVLDLCDKDGNVRLLRQNLATYANSFLSGGETYFLVSTQEDPKQYTYTLLVTLKPDEPPIEIKPTKVDRQERKRATPKAPSKSKKGK